MMAEPTIHVMGIIDPTNRSAVAMPRNRMWRVSPGKKSISMLHAVEGVIQDGRHEPELQHPDERVVVDGGNPVVGVGPPADHRGVHDVGEQEEDDREAAHPVKEPAVLAFVTLCRAGRTGPSVWSPCSPRLSLSSARRGAACRGGQPTRVATRTPSRVGTIVETQRSSAATSLLCSRTDSV